MKLRNNVLALLLAGLLAFSAVACAEGGGGDGETEGGGEMES